MLNPTNSSNSLMTILPQELWREIINYLSIKDELNLKQVSKQSLSLTKEAPFWINVNPKTLVFWQKKCHSGYAAFLKFFNRENHNYKQNALLRFFTGKRIKYCIIEGGNIQKHDLSNIHDLFWSQIPRGVLQTEDLIIENLESLDPTIFQKCLETQGNCKKLKLKKSTFKATTYFWPLAAASLSLEILLLHNCKISELAPALQVLPHLKILILIASDISPTELTYLEPHIRQINLPVDDADELARRFGIIIG